MILRSLHREPNEQEVTDPDLVLSRRRFIQGLGLALGSAWIGRRAWADSCQPIDLPAKDEAITPRDLSTTYNNYYEFSRNKDAVRILAEALTTTPWSLTIEGEVEAPLTLDLDQLHKRFSEEQRIYRLRCVEGWSMVVPWDGIPLCKVLALAKPTSAARYVEFVSLLRPEEMINQRIKGLSWPYTEGLRIDEATHPLTLLATGMYGEPLPKANGAPLRIVVPWKYGFKSPKAITHIRLLREQPQTSWNLAAPSEYGFLGNVNPAVAHPRWSQRRENRIGELRKRPTQAFNGYAEQVAGLYRGIDLSKHF